MLSKPNYGWTNINLGSFNGRGSYLTDIPLDCLNSFINALKYSLPASIHFDEEGSEFILTADFSGVYIISEREKTELIKIEIQFLDLINEVVKDIEDNFNDWLLWTDYYEEHPLKDNEGLKIRKNNMENKINILKSMLNEYKQP